jgi:hypothetical protein
MKKLIAVAILVLCGAAAFAKEQKQYAEACLTQVHTFETHTVNCVADICEPELQTQYTLDSLGHELVIVHVRTGFPSLATGHVLQQLPLRTVVKWRIGKGGSVVDGVPHINVKVSLDGKHESEYFEISYVQHSVDSASPDYDKGVCEINYGASK